MCDYSLQNALDRAFRDIARRERERRGILRGSGGRSREVERRVALAKRYREQIGEQRHNRANIVGRLRYHHFEFAQPLFRPSSRRNSPARSKWAMTG
jgi:hypothetical protein